MHSGGTVYTVEQENWEDQEQKLGVPSMQQRLLLFLFLQHSDPFTLQLSDIMGERQLHVYKHRTCRLCWSLLHLLFFFICDPPFSHRGADRAPPGGYSEAQQASCHKRLAD